MLVSTVTASPATSPLVFAVIDSWPAESDGRGGFDTDALGSVIRKGCERYFSTFGGHEISIARKAGSGQPPGQSPRS